MEVSEVTEIIFLLITLVALLYLANFLADIGTFDQMLVLRGPLEPLLVAVSQQRNARPGLSPEMSEVAAVVRRLGVEEDAPNIMGDDSHEIRRGELVGIYSAHVHPFMKDCAGHVGVVLDVGDSRVTEAKRADWTKRLEGKMEGLNVQIVSVPDTLQSTSRRNGRMSEIIGHWRSYRKLIRKLLIAQHPSTRHPVQLLETISLRKNRVVSVLPVDCKIKFGSS